jgi:hypothetical protein
MFSRTINLITFFSLNCGLNNRAFPIRTGLQEHNPGKRVGFNVRILITVSISSTVQSPAVILPLASFSLDFHNILYTRQDTDVVKNPDAPS